MRYNPCGRIVDFGRRAYTTACRFLRDDDTVGQIRWVEARPDAPTLGYTSGIMSLDDENDPWLPWPLGEVEGSPRRFTGQTAPVGLNGGHVCGTPDEFEFGGTRDDDAPPVRYGALGFPLCCDPPRRIRGGAGAAGRALYHLSGRYKMRGGAGASGRATVTITTGIRLYGGAGASGHPDVSVRTIPRLYGGAGASGRAGAIEPMFVEPVEGGLEIGGEVGEVFTPGTPVPGVDCASAALVALASLYPLDLTAGVEEWFKWELAAGTTYHLTTTGADAAVSIVGYYGGDCPFPTVLPWTVHGTDCRDFTTVAASTLRVKFSIFAGVASITFKLEEGAC